MLSTSKAAIAIVKKAFRPHGGAAYKKESIINIEYSSSHYRFEHILCYLYLISSLVQQHNF